jgi:hypothetical protein
METACGQSVVPRMRRALIHPLAVLLLSVPPVAAQVKMDAGPGGQIQLMGSDLRILDVRERRVDLPCEVVRVEPQLGFDLRFHARFQVRIPMSELAGSENLLTMLFRVTRTDKRGGEPQYFFQRTLVPAFEEDRKGEVYINGSFDLGEGAYQVDWMMRDRAHHYCADNWTLTAKLPDQDRDMALALRPGAIEATEDKYFKEEPPVLRSQEEQLRVKVLVNFAPQKRYSPTLDSRDYLPLVSILRNISRQPHFGKFSLVAFNLEEQRIFYRQHDADRIDFPSLGEAMETVSPATVSLAALGDNAEADFLGQLISAELADEEPVDALIFAGPKASVDERISRQTLRNIGPVGAPIFYLNYNLYPQATPWRDAIGHAIRFLKGMEFTITRPRDLWNAISEVSTAAVKAKETKQGSGASSQ